LFLRLTPVAIFVAVCLAGCGSTAPTKRLGKKEYLRQINEIASSDDARKATRLFDKIVVELPQRKGSCLARTRELEQVLDRLVDRVEGSVRPRRSRSSNGSSSMPRASRYGPSGRLPTRSAPGSCIAGGR